MQTEQKQAPAPSQAQNRANILNLAMAMVEQDNCQGICLACGEEADGVEPDARAYKCEYCGARKVYGAEEICLMLGGL